MAGQSTPDYQFGARRKSLAIILCLLPLLTYLNLSLAYFSRFSGVSASGSYENFGTGASVVAGHPAKPPTPCGSPNRPIYLAESSFQDFAFVSSIQIPEHSSLGRIVALIPVTRFVINGGFRISPNRAPPHSL